MPRWPIFWGSSSNSASLNDSLTRKAQIIDAMLRAQYGCYLVLVQGSPSYSSLSGNTHGGRGDAGDFALASLTGKSIPLAAWIFASRAFRAFSVMSYIRGMDVNGDGRKDDSFDPHIHVIDIEGGGKVLAALSQIGEYMSGGDGLVGSRPDYEKRTSNPITLAQYTALRLTAAIAGLGTSLPDHTQPSEEDIMTPAQEAMLKEVYEYVKRTQQVADDSIETIVAENRGRLADLAGAVAGLQKSADVLGELTLRIKQVTDDSIENTVGDILTRVANIEKKVGA